MTDSLNLDAWRASTREEVVDFVDRDRSKEARRHRSTLVVRTHLRPVDVYTYLVARFGQPNGFQNFLRKDDSDNLIHWDFNIKAVQQDIYLAGSSREVHITVSEKLTDQQWKELLVAIRTDYRKIGKEKSAILHSLEKFAVFQNKFVSLAGLCADLHAAIIDTPPPIDIPRETATKDQAKRYQEAMNKVSERANHLYGNCLKLRLLTPVMAEAFINMVILTFCKSELRDDQIAYEQFVRMKIPDRLSQLHEKCVGFDRAVDKSTIAYAEFSRVIAGRNFALHGNVDPIRETIEIVYFDGKRPLFVNPGNNIERLFEHLEKIHAPDQAINEYEQVHAFLAEIMDCMSAQHRRFFEQVISDAYPGYELKKRRVTRLLPDHVVASIFEGLRYDDQLDVDW
jgi:hypothetical protein